VVKNRKQNNGAMTMQNRYIGLVAMRRISLRITFR